MAEGIGILTSIKDITATATQLSHSLALIGTLEAMAEGFTVAASAISIIGVAIQSIQVVSKTIDNIKDAPKVLRELRSDLDSIQPILAKLDVAGKTESPSKVPDEVILSAVSNCNRVCITLKSRLDHWTKHSTDEKILWFEKFKFAMLGEERVKTAKDQLNTSKSTLILALASASYLTVPKDTLTQRAKDEMQDGEVKIDEEVARIDEENLAIAANMDSISIAKTSAMDTERKEAMQELLAELTAQQEVNKTLLKLCKTTYQEIHYHRTDQKISDIGASEDSATFVGIMNTSLDSSTFDQEISNIHATTRSRVVAGTASGVGFELPHSSAPSSQRNEE